MSEANDKSDNVSMDYWSSARIKSFSTNSEWMKEVYLDAITLLDLAREEGTSDILRLRYTTRAVEALEEIKQFLSNKGE